MNVGPDLYYNISIYICLVTVVKQAESCLIGFYQKHSDGCGGTKEGIWGNCYRMRMQ